MKELPITNKIVVVFDEAKLGKERLREEIARIAERAGLGGKLIFAR